jgi:hypothetical protein
MFNWFKRRKPTPAENSPPTPPPIVTQQEPVLGGKTFFTNGTTKWSEEWNVIESAAQALMQLGHRTISHSDYLEHVDTGIRLKPQLADMQPLERGVRTCTIIDVVHSLTGTQRVFEFQHATGDSITQSLVNGFTQWAQVDLPVFADALQEKPKTCLCMEFPFPAKDGQPARHRRVVLGPVGHLQQHTPRADEASEEHPFCSCCFFTNTYKAFQQHLNSDSCFGIRFYAQCDEQGNAEADCRINGEDFAPGKEALLAYVRQWPNRGFQFRKQYAFVHSVALAP